VPLAVGIDVAKELHWVCVLDMATGGQLQSRKVPNTPEAIDGLIVELGRLSTEHGPVTVGIDVLGGIAGLLTAMLLDPEHRVDLQVVHVPGLLVNRSRRATRGGERKSDPPTRRSSPTRSGCAPAATSCARWPCWPSRTRCCGCWSTAAASWSPTRPGG
jgi:hypothetical protein